MHFSASTEDRLSRLLLSRYSISRFNINRFSISRLLWPLSICFVGGLALLVAALMHWRQPLAPQLHDEFSNLLVADTLLHGRLANPSPELWQPFQSFHLVVNPSYSSKFPVGPGAMMALGYLLVGSTIVGIYLSAAFCAAAVTWAAAGCLPRRWAVLAGLLLALSPNVHHQWSMGYMSGWITAAASALVAGAALRLRRQVRTVDCVVLGFGIGGLALTRPFEGLLFCITSAMLVLFWWRKLDWRTQATRIAQVSIRAALPITAALTLLVAHNQATTGNPWQLPYALHESQYGVAPLNIFQSERQPQMVEWSSDVPPTILSFHYGWSLDSYRKRNHFIGWCGAVAERLHVVSTLWGPLFCLVSLITILRLPRAYGPMAIAIGLALLAGSFVPWYFAHYFAPSLVWLVILSVVGLHFMTRQLTSDRRAMRMAIACVMLMQATLMSCEIAAANARPVGWSDARASLERKLIDDGGKHLIFVRYHPNHNVHHEWVYNGADLENASVVWARSWRPDLDEQLIAHYADRQIWWLELDDLDQPHLHQ